MRADEPAGRQRRGRRSATAAAGCRASLAPRRGRSAGSARSRPAPASASRPCAVAPVSEMISGTRSGLVLAEPVGDARAAARRARLGRCAPTRPGTPPGRRGRRRAPARPTPRAPRRRPPRSPGSRSATVPLVAVDQLAADQQPATRLPVGHRRPLAHVAPEVTVRRPRLQSDGPSDLCRRHIGGSTCSTRSSRAAPSSTVPVRPACVADVGIRDGRIVAIGTIDEAAATVVDATGLRRRPRLRRPAHPLRRPAPVGSRPRARRACTASPPSSAATAASRSRRCAPATPTTCAG